LSPDFTLLRAFCSGSRIHNSLKLKAELFSTSYGIALAPETTSLIPTMAEGSTKTNARMVVKSYFIPSQPIPLPQERALEIPLPSAGEGQGEGVQTYGDQMRSY
jgi:hypothetical protein